MNKEEQCSVGVEGELVRDETDNERKLVGEKEIENEKKKKERKRGTDK